MPYDKKFTRGGGKGIPRAVRDDGPRGGRDFGGEAPRGPRGSRNEARGYKGTARPDKGPQARPERYGDRPAHSGDRPFGRPDRSAPRRDARPERSERFDRFDRSERPAYPSRPPRAPRPQEPRRFKADSPFGDIATDPLERYMNAPAAPAAETAPEMPENMLVGRNPIREAIKSGRDIEKLMVARGDLSGSAREIIAKAREAGVIVQEVDRVRLDALYKGHQGMIAFVSAAPYADLDAIMDAAKAKGEPPFVIVLDGITDPHNLGAIIRTAECAGAHGVIIPERRGVGLTPAAVKASAGACEYVPVARVTNIHRTLDELKAQGLWVIGATMDGEDAFTADLSGAVALVIGAEGEGLSELTKKKCDMTLKLPLMGHIDSLNASVAAGVMMYAVLNARRS